MNPVLLKPEHERGSQVVVLGRVRADLAALPWRGRSEVVWPVARAALDALRAENDVVVIEGAGSPAEINLHASDYVNMRCALAANAACLLVADIDRGGAFAHLYGTHQLLPPDERALIRGFVLNRFRGDPALLAPGPQQLQALTGVPTLAVLPMWRAHGLPEEDGVFDAPVAEAARGALRVAIVAYPCISNLDEFEALRHQPGVSLRWARSPADAGGADWIVLPGSKQVGADLAWLRAQRLDAAIATHAAAGGAVLGICGGLQMLGEALSDPHGVDGAAYGTEHGAAQGAPHADRALRGLGLLPLLTTFERDKLLRRTRAQFAELDGPWRALAGSGFDGYEIRHGHTRAAARAAADAPCIDATAPGMRVALRDADGAPIGWQRGSVLGISAHGLFESAPALHALFGGGVRGLDAVFDGLADFVDRHFAAGVLDGLLRASPR